MPLSLPKDHTLIQSADSSYTAYSSEYGECYHAKSEGALLESLQKHIKPAFAHTAHKEHLAILDICFGLGFNTLATIFYARDYAPTKSLSIYSPELNGDLVASLQHFCYPKEFKQLNNIIQALSKEGYYEEAGLCVRVHIGDAREYVRRFNNYFDIIYQDPFSPKKNPKLWSVEYFSDIAKAAKEDAILTTYSTALVARLAMHQNGFLLYQASAQGVRDFTLASRMPLSQGKRVDMAHKIACNLHARPIYDSDLA